LTLGFYEYDENPVQAPTKVKGLSLAALHAAGCSLCPLAKNKKACSPDMKPSGAKRPLVYILGDQPLREDDLADEQMRGDAGKYLRRLIPDDFDDAIRFNNAVRTRTPKDRVPDQVEIECCRPSIIKDIERQKPVAIFGFGALPLKWVTDQSQSLPNWRGKRMPVKIGSHTCWFYVFNSPADIIESWPEWYEPGKSSRKWGSDIEFAFQHDLRTAFKQVRKGLPKPVVHSFEDAERDVRWVTGAKPGDLRTVLDWFDKCEAADACGFDYETNALRPYRDGKLLTLSLSIDDGTLAFPLDHRQSQFSNEDRATIRKRLKRFLLTSKHVHKAVHNLAFELEWSCVTFSREVAFTPKWECTQSQSFVLDTRAYAHSLDFKCYEYFGLPIKDMTTTLDKNNLDGCELEQVLRYNGVDSKYHLLVYRYQVKLLRQRKLDWVYDEHMRRVPAAVLTQVQGVPVDQATVTKFDKRLRKELRVIEDNIFNEPDTERYAKKFGHEFEPSNQNHVKRLFNDLLKMNLEKTEKLTLEKVKHPLAKLVLEHRGVAKLKSTYVDVLKPESPLVYPDGKFHAVIATTKVRTSRTSSEDPNAQNWPKRGAKVFIREQVKVDDDHVIVAIDYAGIQGRNVAMESLDKRLTESFWNHYDIHHDWLERLIRRYPKFHKLTKEQDPKEWKEKRSLVKNRFVFPTFFGAYPKKLATELHVPLDIGEGLREEFFGEFRDIHKWHEVLKENFERTGYVTGLSGYRQYAPISPNQMINSPIQADECVIVCAAWDSLSRERNRYLQPVMMIHDDLTFIFPRKRLEEYIDIAVDHMTRINFPWINCPLEVEVSTGQDWANLKEIGKYERAPGWKSWKQISG
jgi:DNA polymerase-1